MRRPSSASPPNDEPKQRGIDFGWRTHSAITDWTAKVDTKAAITLSVSGAVLGFFVTLSGSGRVLSSLRGWRHVIEVCGFIFTALAVLLAALVVMPRLKRRQARKVWKDNFIYFGHLRRWKPADVHKRLAAITEDEELEVLATQLVATSKIAWYKHSTLQYAILALLAGALLVALAAGWPH